MLGNLLISIILIVIIAAQIAITLNTATELDKIRRALKSTKAELNKYKKLAYSSRNPKRFAAPKKPPKKMSGDLDLYHGGRTATVKAVFRPREY